MKSLTTAAVSVCLALSAGMAFAQDTTKAATKMDAKKDMSTQDCKDHMNTMKGQKRTDPATADTAAKCNDMKPGKMGSDSMKPAGSMGASSPAK